MVPFSEQLPDTKTVLFVQHFGFCKFVQKNPDGTISLRQASGTELDIPFSVPASLTWKSAQAVAETVSKHMDPSEIHPAVRAEPEG